jgi:N-acetylneuraminate synthase
MVYFIAEIGINHNGDIDICKDLIRKSKESGADYVKIQKRNPDVCVPEHQKDKRKNTPWGEMSYLEYKKRIEFNEDQISELFEFSKQLEIKFFASVWDKDSVDLMSKYTSLGKIPSALINDLELCEYARKHFKTLIISTGMSTEEEIESCINACEPDVIMHTNSTYPCPAEDLNLRYIEHLKDKYSTGTGIDIGYSGHEQELETTYASVALGARWVERHITLSRDMWGSDQSCSIEIDEMSKLIKGIRNVAKAIKYPPGERIQFEKEDEKRKTLRKKIFF